MSRLKKSYHKRFASIVKDLNFKNVLLVSKDAQVIFSSFKDKSGNYLGRNILNGKLSSTRLKMCFEQAMNKMAGEVSFTGFFQGPYGPTSFFCSRQDAEFDHLSEGIKVGDLMGIVVAEYSHHQINSITTLGDSLGESSETFVLGSDNLLRNDLRLRKDMNVKHSFVNEQGYDNIKIEDYDSNKPFVEESRNGLQVDVLRYVNKVKALGLNYLVLIEKNKSEILSPVRMITKYSLYGAIFTFIITSAVGFFFARGISNKVTAITEVLKDSTDQVRNSSKSVSDNSDQLSRSSTNAASSLQQTVASIDEISSMVQKNADSASLSTNVSKKSTEAAIKGKEVVEEMIKSINQISESNNEVVKIVQVISDIGEKTKVINDIVFQTKLLSINASVEAARAGEHGKGFAVVAEEVGNLAAVSGKAALEITNMLDQSVKQVKEVVDNTRLLVSEGTKNALDCGDSLDEILQNVTKVNEMIGEISSASMEQSAGVREVTSAMQELDQVTHQNSTVAQDSAKMADFLNSKAMSLDVAVKGLVSIVNGETDQPADDNKPINFSRKVQEEKSFKKVS